MKDKKYLTETEKFEKWKLDFKESVKDQLSDMFAKCYGKDAFELGICDVDKWNIEFVITIIKSYYEDLLRKYNTNFSLQDVLSKLYIKNTNGYFQNIRFRIEAKSKEELDAKLMYLNLLF